MVNSVVFLREVNPIFQDIHLWAILLLKSLPTSFSSFHPYLFWACKKWTEAETNGLHLFISIPHARMHTGSLFVMRWKKNISFRFPWRWMESHFRHFSSDRFYKMQSAPVFFFFFAKPQYVKPFPWQPIPVTQQNRFVGGLPWSDSSWKQHPFQFPLSSVCVCVCVGLALFLFCIPPLTFNWRKVSHCQNMDIWSTWFIFVGLLCTKGSPVMQINFCEDQ